MLILLSSCSANRRTTSLWSEVSDSVQAKAPELLPRSYALYQLDLELLKTSLKDVGSSQEEGIFVQFPGPSGAMVNFKVWRSSVVSEKMLKKYLNLLTYQGFDISDVKTSIRLELPEGGLQVMVNSMDAPWYIAPYDLEQQLYMAYFKSEYPSTNNFWEGRIK